MESVLVKINTNAGSSLEDVYARISAELDTQFMATTVKPNRLACLDDTYKAVESVIMGSTRLMKMLGHAHPALAVYGSTVNSLAQ